jgi:hypothetical protein
MRKLIVLLATAGLLLGITGSAQAGDMDDHNSTLGLIIGALPSVTISATPGTGGPSPPGLVLLSDSSLLGFSVGHNILVQSSIWSTINFGPGTSLFTGVPLVSNLKFTVHNRPGVLQDGFNGGTNSMGGGHPIGPAFGGVLRLRGVTIVSALAGAILLPVPLDHVGGLIGETTMATLIGNNLTATNGPFMTDTWKITGITTNIITIPARAGVQGVGFTLQATVNETAMTFSTNGGFVSISGGNPDVNHMVTITGTNSLLSGSKAGMVTVIAPLRIQTGTIANTIPGSATIKLTFVPEPGTMLLLVSGAVGLAVIGRRRMRK